MLHNIFDKYDKVDETIVSGEENAFARFLQQKGLYDTTDNPTLYGVLSKGVHELTEIECIEYFPVVRDCIFMILNEWEEMRKRKEKEESIGKELSKIASKVK